jgi:antitoxin component HigA of HigAB toxin-antitoxin module
MPRDPGLAVCRSLNIRAEADFEAALQEIEGLFDCQPDTPEADRLDVLVALVESYEAQHHRIPAPDPIEAIEHEMERQGPDLVPAAELGDLIFRDRDTCS